jgi:hypothetical protein
LLFYDFSTILIEFTSSLQNYSNKIRYCIGVPIFCRKDPRKNWGLAIWPLAGLGTEEWHGGRIPAGSLAGGEGKYGEEKEETEEYLLEVLVGLGVDGGGGATEQGLRRSAWAAIRHDSGDQDH